MKGMALIFLAAAVAFLPFGLDREARVLFVGDMSFDRYVRQIVERKGEDFIFSCIGEYLKKSDLVVGNLEGPITDKQSVSTGSEVGSPQNFVFTFPTSTAKLLAKYNIKLVNIGNNHIGNFGISGISSTRKYLEGAIVNYFGGIATDTKNFPAEPVYRTRLGGVEISFISYNQFGGAEPNKIAERITSERKEGKEVIVYAHWGEEYTEPTVHMRKAAEMFANAGARAVIGSHPHVVQESGKLNDTFVYYSLGNFIFDQYWSEDVQTGLLLEMKINGGEFEIVEHEVSINRDGTTCLADANR